MSACACLWGGDGDLPDFYNEVTRRARKAYTCIECKQPIQPRQKYVVFTGKWDGQIKRYRTCALCHEIRMQLYCENWCFGELWEDIVDQLFRNGLMNSACLEKLKTPEAKQYLSRRWWEWVESRQRNDGRPAPISRDQPDSYGDLGSPETDRH